MIGMENREVEMHIVFLTLYLLHIHAEVNDDDKGKNAIMNLNSQRHLYPNDLTT